MCLAARWIIFGLGDHVTRFSLYDWRCYCFCFAALGVVPALESDRRTTT